MLTDRIMHAQKQMIQKQVIKQFIKYILNPSYFFKHLWKLSATCPDLCMSCTLECRLNFHQFIPLLYFCFFRTHLYLSASSAQYHSPLCTQFFSSALFSFLPPCLNNQIFTHFSQPTPICLSLGYRSKAPPSWSPLLGALSWGLINLLKCQSAFHSITLIWFDSPLSKLKGIRMIAIRI